MNRAVLFGIACTGLMLAASCSQSGPGSTTQGSGGSGGITTGAGGASGSGGMQSSWGSQSSGGSGGSDSGGATGNGGSSASGGATGNGGSSALGGATGNGGSTVSGGATGKGGAGGSASGGATGNGGTTGSGGTSTKPDAAVTGGASGAGGAGAGGTTGSGGSSASGGTTGTGGSSGAITPADVVPDLATGFYWEDSCMGNFDPGGHNCWTDAQSTTCPGSGNDVDKTLSVKGTSGQKYTVNIEVRGVVGTRCYQGGKAASTAAISDTGYNNWWYAGGSPYNSTGWWNTYELHVSPSTGDASKDVYYFNNSSNTATSGGDCEREASYLVKYTASFKVVGGGSLLFRVHDNNCKAMMNCGTDTVSSDPCAPRTVDLSGMVPQPPSTSPAAKQPPANTFTKTYYPQWMWIAATSVTSP